MIIEHKRNKNQYKVFFKNKYLSNTTVTPEDAIISSASNPASVLKKTTSTTLDSNQNA